MTRIKSAMGAIGGTLVILAAFTGIAFFGAVLDLMKIIFMVLLIYAFDLLSWVVGLFS